MIKLLYGNAFAIRKEKQKAISYMQQSLGIAQKNDFKDIVLAAHRSLANLYNAYGDYKKAWQHGHQYINLQQNLFDETTKNINSINALESKYQLSLKDNELMQRELLITRQEKNLAQKSLLNIILTSSALGAFTLALLIFIFYRNYKRKQQLLIQKKEIAQLKEIMKAEENERSRLARELHDGIGSMLAAVKMNLGTVKKEHATLAGIHQLDTISHMLEDTSSELRKAAHNLMPDVLNKHHLEDALLLYFSQMNVTNELKIDLHCHGNLNQLSKSQELVLYRIVQELIQNILKHAEANKVEIQLMQYGDTLALTVEDNGKGFDVQEYNGGFVLQNLRYRIQSLHGSMHITSVADKNTTIYIEFDLKKLKFAVG